MQKTVHANIFLARIEFSVCNIELIMHAIRWKLISNLIFLSDLTSFGISLHNLVGNSNVNLIQV